MQFSKEMAPKCGENCPSRLWLSWFFGPDSQSPCIFRGAHPSVTDPQAMQRKEAISELGIQVEGIVLEEGITATLSQICGNLPLRSQEQHQQQCQNHALVPLCTPIH